MTWQWGVAEEASRTVTPKKCWSSSLYILTARAHRSGMQSWVTTSLSACFCISEMFVRLHCCWYFCSRSLPELELLCRRPACWYSAAAWQVIGRALSQKCFCLAIWQMVQGDLWCIVGRSCGTGCQWEGFRCRGIMEMTPVEEFRGRKKQKFFRLLHDTVVMTTLKKKK